jgi:hypothetical protein
MLIVSPFELTDRAAAMPFGFPAGGDNGIETARIRNIAVVNHVHWLQWRRFRTSNVIDASIFKPWGESRAPKLQTSRRRRNNRFDNVITFVLLFILLQTQHIKLLSWSLSRTTT